MNEIVVVLEGGVQVTGTPAQVDPEQVSLLAQASEVDGVMLSGVRFQGGGAEVTLPWLYVPFVRVVACGVAQPVDEDEARTRLAFLVQGIRKSHFSSRGANEGLRSVENE
ncbi:hypothetical protein DAETH_43440 (plasmid) [Deinococcus aetherius]|uniref:Uncharacterized protein n=1 Tax=Deinococcus aetherius TaxID=200252 RepID=A0ABM8AKM9_9DEIO|nr:hypothetical protein [Deinococcus aetherius]BDP44375.1 hypothetical protein DAETH_43440 [Deinococcus aetherius]